MPPYHPELKHNRDSDYNRGEACRSLQGSLKSVGEGATDIVGVNVRPISDRCVHGPDAFVAEECARAQLLDENGPDGGPLQLGEVQYMGKDFITGDYADSISKSSLRSRGWVFQELLLSRRCLTFSGSGGYFVECQRVRAHTLYGDQVGTDDSRWLTDASFRQKLNRNLTTKSLWSQALFSWWPEIIERYSGLEFTKVDQDRLVALSGLARKFGAALERREPEDPRMPYISGLCWGFHRGLLWEQAPPAGGERTRVRLRGIPSWSWASIAIPVRDGHGVIKRDAQGREVLSGLPVRWSTTSQRQPLTEACRWGEQCRTVEVDSQTLEPRVESVSVLDCLEEMDMYGTVSRFAIIELVGKVISVQIRGRFPNRGDANIAAVMTDHRLGFGRDLNVGIS